MDNWKGTKGNWELSKDGEESILPYIKLPVYKRFIFVEGSNHEEQLANAKAIKEVPAMIEALQHSLRVAKTLPNKDSIGVKMLIKNLEQTLNKAL